MRRCRKILKYEKEKQKMKKFLALMLALAMVFALAACDSIENYEKTIYKRKML
jgi:uncharacterized lipoprotein YehR (DUF1307 family)